MDYVRRVGVFAQVDAAEGEYGVVLAVFNLRQTARQVGALARLILLGVALAALITSVLYARYIRVVSAGRPLDAAFTDLGLMLMTSLTTQAWFVEHGNFLLLLTYDIVAAVGTYFAVKIGGTSLIGHAPGEAKSRESHCVHHTDGE